MGQYYTPILRKPLANKHYKNSTFYSHEYDNGLKLMEHSYFENRFVNAVCNALIDNPQKVIWLGDYTENGMDLRLTKKQISFLHSVATDKRFRIEPTARNQKFDWNEQWYLINDTKRTYIDMKQYFEKAPHAFRNWNDGEKWVIHPLPLLTASSNGMGGGDYNGELGSDAVGTWCNDALYSGKEKPVADYSEVCYYFQEQG